MKLHRILVFVACMIVLSCVSAAAAFAADDDFVVEGGTAGTDYTYENGVLTFLRDGAYTVKMREGVTQTDNQIQVNASGYHNPGFDRVDLTLDNLNIDSGSKTAFEGFYGNRTSAFQLNVTLNGKNTLKSTNNPWASNSMYVSMTVKAASGTTSDELVLNGPSGQDISLGYFTWVSGKLSMPGGMSIMVNKIMQVDSGEIYVSSPESAGVIYVNGKYIQNGGKVTLETSGTRCIQVVGVEDVQGDGVIINGGDLTCTATGSSGGGAIHLGNRLYKNLVINTEGTVTINAKYIGIAIEKAGSISMKNGNLNIAGQFGVYIPNEAGGSGGMSFSGGRTEIIATGYGMVINTPTKLSFASTYDHKDYTGASKETRAEVTDNQLISSVNERLKKYILITPAYKITYDLAGGHLEEGKVNPESYLSDEEIILNNPSKDGHDFIGWTGTYLDQPTMNVTIPEGSTGPRSYTANYEKKKYKIEFETNGGTAVADQDVAYMEKIDQSLINTERDGYTLDGWCSDAALQTPFDLETEITEPKKLYAKWTEKQATFTYVASQGGTVSPASETVKVITGTASGSTAAADTESGYQFVCWTDTESAMVSEDPTFVPEKKDGKYVSATYVANFQKENEKIILIEPAEDKTYNGKPQTAYAGTEAYDVENGTATNAGTYKAKITPKNGYTWPDGSTDSKELSFKIKKKQLTASYAGETIEWYGTPKLPVKVTGFVNGETAKTAKGYKAPKVKKPSYKPHQTYTLKPSGGEAANYSFSYKSGKLKVNCKDILLVRLTPKGRTVKLTWNKVRGATMFKLYKSHCGKDDCKYAKTLNSGNKTSFTYKNLGSKPYKFFVAAYRKSGGKTKRLAVSEVAHCIVNNSEPGYADANSIKTNKKSATIKKGKSTRVKTTVKCRSGRKLFYEDHCDKVRYYSSDIHIAKVSSYGKITGVRKGKCKIYAVAPNGLKAAVNVTVK